jgi:hypothetical protein
VNEDVTDMLFGRLAVAWGLSFDSLSIGEIMPPSEIEDMEHRIAETPQQVSKDQV